MGTINTHLNREEELRFRALARKLGITEYALLKLIVLEFLKDPSAFPNIFKLKLKI